MIINGQVPWTGQLDIISSKRKVRNTTALQRGGAWVTARHHFPKGNKTDAKRTAATEESSRCPTPCPSGLENSRSLWPELGGGPLPLFSQISWNGLWGSPRVVVGMRTELGRYARGRGTTPEQAVRVKWDDGWEVSLNM